MNLQPATKHFWRSLEQLTAPEAFAQSAQNEFAPGASDPKTFDRRSFLKFLGASMALAGIPACTRQPVEKIIPYVNQPERLVPGKPLYFATAMTPGGFATGLLVESHEGHPTKIEGNPSHPASLGATTIFQQAALLDLYDPNRSKKVLNHGQPRTWEDFVSALKGNLEPQLAARGSRLRILTETVTSPTLHSQLRSLTKEFPLARWHQYEPVNRDNAKLGAQLAFGEFVETHYHLDKARVILSLDSDFLYLHPESLRHAREFASQRRARFPQNAMSRFYAVESCVSTTGTNADHRLPLAWREIEGFVLSLANRLQAVSNPVAPARSPLQEQWISAVAQDLLGNRGQCAVLAGDNQPPLVHALAHSLNHFLGNVGTTITFTESAEAAPVLQVASLRELTEALNRGEVDTIILLGGNPVFNAPVDFDFGRALTRARFKVHLSSDLNETSRLCDWHIPENHFLESWSDARAFDGTISIVQPLIQPLYEGRSAHELLEAMVTTKVRRDYDIVHDYWRLNNLADDFESRWRRALRDGVVEDSALPAKKCALRPFEIPAQTVAVTQAGLEVTFHPDPTILDGRHASNAWLQELPKPVTKLVWDNAAYISPALARREKLSDGDVIEITSQNRMVYVPICIVPGQPENTLGLQFGHGRTSVNEKTGCDIFPLRTSDTLAAAGPVTLRKTGAHRPLATTQTQHVIDSEDRQIFREGTFAEFVSHADFVKQTSEAPTETLFDPNEFKHDGYRWGMAIDLSACIGCSACVTACQAENNIPTVGKAEVMRGRAMHWIRVDSYFKGAPEAPETNHQPVPCMHCENAPCELVCPVGATVHDHEGLNLQVYNRCVGTRYCSNNCPYKVRRFNFFQYADEQTPSLKPMRNPNVTVRSRGVMEKCTYCIQRISAARIEAEQRGEKIGDGKLRTACQQVCPAQAITFGDLGDPNSAVSKIKTHPLNFLMLGQLNTRPRTTYLAKLRNPNPALIS